MAFVVKKIGHKLSIDVSFYRMGLWLIVIVLALHLIGSTYHKHKLAAQSSDSVSCYVDANLLSYTPSVAPKAFTAPALFISPIGLFLTLDFVSIQSYFIPLSQAPPQDAASV